MNRDILEAEAEGYRKGRESLENEYSQGTAILRVKDNIYIHSRMVDIEREEFKRELIKVHQKALVEGRSQGIPIGRAQVGEEREIEWRKLSRLIFWRCMNACLFTSIIVLVGIYVGISLHIL